MRRRIKHNNLLPWFLEDHGQLPVSYVHSCEKFFKELSLKHQAPSCKRQAPGTKLDSVPASGYSRIIKEKL